jgi:tyrosine-protein kinase Etk/Wzc
MILVLLINQLTTPVYEAEATLIYAEPEDAKFALNADQPFMSRSALLNLAEQLRTRSLAKEVVQALPEQIIAEIRPLAPTPTGSPEDAFIDKYLQENLTVNLVPGTDVLKIKIQANNPETAKIIVNTYAERIIDWKLKRKREEISNIREFVDEQLTVFKGKLDAAEEALLRFKQEQKMISLNESSVEILKRMTQVEFNYNQIKAERAALEQRRRSIEQKKQELAPSFTIASTPRAQELKKRLHELELQHTESQAQGLAENHPEMQALKQNISQVQQELVQELVKTTQRNNLVDPLSQIKSLMQESIDLEVNLETNKAKEQGLKQILAGYEAELQRLPQHELQLARLVRERDVNDRIYSTLLEKREEVRITEAGKVGDVHIIDTAEEPIVASEPKKTRNIVLGLFLGMFFGVGLAFFLESLDTSLKSREDVEKYMNLPVLAAIPTIKNGKSKTDTLSLTKRDPQTPEAIAGKLFSHLNGNTHIYEAYRSLFVNFAFINTDGGLKSILVTSAGVGEGKTLTAINMAQVFAGSGVRTLLVDCDLRCPTIHKILSLDKEPGLTNVLINQITFDRAIQGAKTENLSVLSCGTQPRNPSEVLHTKNMRNLLADLKKEFDLIILDAPPLIAVTDSVILSTEVDGVCLVIKSGRTSHDAALRARQLLENSHTRIIGTILNDVDLEKVYGYRDAHYYKTENAAGKKRVAERS